MKNLLKMDKKIIQHWLKQPATKKSKADIDRDIVYFDTKAMLIKKNQIKPTGFGYKTQKWGMA